VSAEHREARDDVVTRPDVVHPGADGFHDPGRFVTEQERHREHHDVPLQRVHVTVTDAARLHAHEDLTRARFVDVDVVDGRLAGYRFDDCCSHVPLPSAASIVLSGDRRKRSRAR